MPRSAAASLAPTLAADCLNAGLPEADGDARLLLNGDASGHMTARAITSDRYSRIWNADITARLLDLEAGGVWQPAPAAFDGSRGLYLGDRDMFAFMVDNERRIFETLPGGGLSRGFFAWNSEVGAASFGIMTFLYEYVCGNHRVWGAKQVSEVRLRHVGEGLDHRAFSTLRATLINYANTSASEAQNTNVASGRPAAALFQPIGFRQFAGLVRRRSLPAPHSTLRRCSTFEPEAASSSISS